MSSRKFSVPGRRPNQDEIRLESIERGPRAFHPADQRGAMAEADVVPSSSPHSGPHPFRPPLRRAQMAGRSGFCSIRLRIVAMRSSWPPRAVVRNAKCQNLRHAVLTVVPGSLHCRTSSQSGCHRRRGCGSHQHRVSRQHLTCRTHSRGYAYQRRKGPTMDTIPLKVFWLARMNQLPETAKSFSWSVRSSSNPSTCWKTPPGSMS